MPTPGPSPLGAVPEPALEPALEPAPEPAALDGALATWYAAHHRALPWRESGTTPWGVLVSEVMLQQTPVVRVAPAWRAWLAAWPTPAALAAADPADVLRAWDRLGYPRRALRLQACAAAITADHAGVVPEDEATLRTLPGIGEYTAAAVSAFAYGRRAVVLDTNVRRVLARLLGGVALEPPTLTRAERARAHEALPVEPAASALWNIALMELGALVCTARTPACETCPVRAACAWRAAGFPPDEHAARRRRQAWHGTDRQARGRVMALARAAPDGVTRAEVAAAWPDAAQLDRAVASLVHDGLLVRTATGLALPGRGCADPEHPTTTVTT